METSSKTIGDGLRRLFAPFTRRLMGWRLIDAFAHLEEREEALRDGDENNDDHRRPNRKVAEKAHYISGAAPNSSLPAIALAVSPVG